MHNQFGLRTSLVDELIDLLSRESVSHFVSRYLAREERNRFARDLLRASWLHQKHLVEVD